jgi:hypothetical protein
MNTTVTSPTSTYTAGARLGSTDRFALYACTLPDGMPGILKIATTREYNGVLEREAFILQLLSERANSIEEQAAEAEPGKGELGYRKFFPTLVESFTAPDQGNRQVLILSFAEVCKELGELVPIQHLISRENVRVDPKTSVWIMGKLLKMLDFTRLVGVTTVINGDNILLNREKHVVLIFDWSGSSLISMMDNNDARAKISGEEISTAAKEVIAALGGDPKLGVLPKDSQLEDNDYERLLAILSSGEVTHPGEAHEKFYTYVRSIWPIKYHPFTVHPVD